MGKKKKQHYKKQNKMFFPENYLSKSINDIRFKESLEFPEEFLSKSVPEIDLVYSDSIESHYFEERIINNTKRKASSVSNDQLATILLEKHNFIKHQELLYVWDDNLGYYIHFHFELADQFIRRNIPSNFKGKITSNSIKEIIQWLKAENSLDIDDNHHVIFDDSLLLFNNCILDLKTGERITPSTRYFFTSAINANYKTYKYNANTKFENFMFDITNGNKFLYKRLQELFGAALSNTRSVKYIPFLVGVKDSGKTLTLKLLENLIDEKNCSNLSFDQLNKAEYLAELVGKRLNTCAETSELTINRLDILKKLSGNDPLMARPIYGSPIKFINTALLIFAGNHLPTISSIDNLNAFSKRLEIFPFNYPTPKEKQDPALLEKLIAERDYIASWAVEGWKRWKSNNYKFTSCKEVEVLINSYNKQSNSLDSFINDKCILDPTAKIHSPTLVSAYQSYCTANNIIPVSSKAFHQYFKSISNLEYSKFRLGKDANTWGYKGIKLAEYI